MTRDGYIDELAAPEGIADWRMSSMYSVESAQTQSSTVSRAGDLAIDDEPVLKGHRSVPELPLRASMTMDGRQNIRRATLYPRKRRIVISSHIACHR